MAAQTHPPITGGDGASAPLATAEFFNTDGSISPAATMNVACSRHISVVLQDGRVLVAGGKVAGGGATNAAEIYDPISNEFVALSDLCSPKWIQTLALEPSAYHIYGHWPIRDHAAGRYSQSCTSGARLPAFHRHFEDKDKT